MFQCAIFLHAQDNKFIIFCRKKVDFTVSEYSSKYEICFWFGLRVRDRRCLGAAAGLKAFMGRASTRLSQAAGFVAVALPAAGAAVGELDGPLRTKGRGSSSTRDDKGCNSLAAARENGRRAAGTRSRTFRRKRAPSAATRWASSIVDEDGVVAASVRVFGGVGGPPVQTAASCTPRPTPGPLSPPARSRKPPSLISPSMPGDEGN